MSKVHIYFMPGLAASSSIFEKIKLPEDVFEIHLLDWIIPEKTESLKQYAERMSKFVKHDKAVLIGVSFGGILAFEMALRLQEMGVHIPLLVLIDTPTTELRLTHEAETLKSSIPFVPENVIKAFEFANKQYFRTYFRLLRLYRDSFFYLNLKLPAAYRKKYISDTYVKIARKYNPVKKFNGNTLIFKAVGNSLVSDNLGWEQWVENISEVVNLERDHDTIFESEQNIATIQAKIKEHIEMNLNQGSKRQPTVKVKNKQEVQ